ncbi:MAG TPA: Re/Si-specific NAD(P)(+) transhydrogenase subunit alpha [Bacillota bacterium]
MVCIAVPRERAPGERRVAVVPDGVKRLVDLGARVLVEEGAGAGAHIRDEEYTAAGAELVADVGALYEQADIVVAVRRPRATGDGEPDPLLRLRAGAVVIALLDPLRDRQVVELLIERNITGLSLDRIPRTTRAQEMDVLSSQATVAGYKAVLLAAAALDRFFPMLVTAAGTIAPAKVLVLGAGVAGLQAIATARRLGAVVEAFDVRPAVKEQVESLGARFLAIELGEAETEAEGGYARQLAAEAQQRERELIRSHVATADVVITTAQVPGQRAPRLITADMVAAMKAGSVIVDLAAESGGNCELTEPGGEVVQHGVRILGPENLPATVPVHASQMFSRNVTNLLALLLKDGKLHLDFDDEIINGCCVAHDGRGWGAFA